MCSATQGLQRYCSIQGISTVVQYLVIQRAHTVVQRGTVRCLPAELVKKNKKTEEDMAELEEHKALSVLHRWGDMREFIEGAYPLVPEHVEVRSLLNAEKPGLPQVSHPFPTDPLCALRPRRASPGRSDPFPAGLRSHVDRHVPRGRARASAHQHQAPPPHKVTRARQHTLHVHMQPGT